MLTVLTGIILEPQQQDYKTFETYNKSIALNILRIPHNTEKISHVYKSGFNKTREKQVILLILSDDQRKQYTAVKNLNSLLRTGNGCSEKYCLNCFKSFRTKLKPEMHHKNC